MASVTYPAAAAGEDALGPVVSRVLVANQTNFRLELTGTDDSLLVLPPLQQRELPPEEAALYPLREAANRNILRVEAKLRTPTPFFLLRLARRQELRSWTRRLPLRAAELGIFGLVLCAAIGVPAGAVILAGDLTGAIGDLGDPDFHERAASHLVGSGVLFLLLAAFIGLPALLYFSFDRARLETLRAKFVVHVFRFDPSIETLADVDARYGRLMDDAYGRETLTGRVLPGKRLPVVLATAAIALGWLLSLRITSYKDARHLSAINYLVLEDSAISFAFLGAYFFALNLAFRGFVRGDLRPKTYSQMAVRVLVAFILGFVIERAFTYDNTRFALALAFVGGIVPETVVLRLRELVRTRRRRDPADALEDRQPLTDLEGIDLYDRARLLDEGVTNVEGLAHHDVVDLMLKTRIPAPRLLDWVDQAILYLHLGGASPDAEAMRALLRRHGIRTATDLIAAGDDATSLAAPLALVVESLRREEWIELLQNWRDRAGLETRTYAFVPGVGLQPV